MGIKTITMANPISKIDQTHNNKNNTARKIKYKNVTVQTSYYIANSKKLTNLDKTVWEFYRGTNPRNQKFYPTNKYIADTIGADPESVTLSRKKLIELKCLEPLREPINYIRRYRALDPWRGTDGLKFIQFPKSIAYAPREHFSHSQKAIIRSLMVKHYKSDDIGITLNQLIERNRISRRTVLSDIKKLEKFGMITIVRGLGVSKSTYRLTEALKSNQFKVINKPKKTKKELAELAITSGRQKPFLVGVNSATLLDPNENPSYVKDENSFVDNSPPPQQKSVKKTESGKELNTPLGKTGSKNGLDVRSKAPHTASSEPRHQNRTDAPVDSKKVYSLDSRKVYFKRMNEIQRLKLQIHTRQLKHDYEVRTSERANRITNSSGNKISQPADRPTHHAHGSKKDGFNEIGSFLSDMVSLIDPR